MTIQEKKTFLGRYQNCELEIKRTQGEIAQWESRAERCTASYSFVRGTGGNDQIQDAVDVLTELRGLLYGKLGEAAQTRTEIECAIVSVEDDRLRLLLEYRYIDGMTFEKVADRMNYSWRQVLNLHRQALERIKLMPRLPIPA